MDYALDHDDFVTQIQYLDVASKIARYALRVIAELGRGRCPMVDWRRWGVAILCFSLAAFGRPGAGIGWATGCADAECVPDPLPECNEVREYSFVCDSCGFVWDCFEEGTWSLTDIACDCVVEGLIDEDRCPENI